MANHSSCRREVRSKQGRHPIALIRELREELGIGVSQANIVVFGTFEAVATGSNNLLIMDVFSVHRWEGTITASSEVEELRWVDSQSVADIELSSIFLHNVLPRLVAEGCVM